MMNRDELSHGVYLGHHGQVLFLERVLSSGRCDWRTARTLRPQRTTLDYFARIAWTRLPNGIGDRLRQHVASVVARQRDTDRDQLSHTVGPVSGQREKRG